MYCFQSGPVCCFDVVSRRVCHHVVLLIDCRTCVADVCVDSAVLVGARLLPVLLLVLPHVLRRLSVLDPSSRLPVVFPRLGCGIGGVPPSLVLCVGGCAVLIFAICVPHVRLLIMLCACFAAFFLASLYLLVLVLLFLSLSLCLPVYVSACQSVCPCVSPLVSRSLSMLVPLSIGPSPCLSASLSVSQSLSVCSSGCLSVRRSGSLVPPPLRRRSCSAG